MTERQVDYCLIGQGLAGSTLAWTLLLRGRSVFVIDRAEAVTASRIAAGLLTPVTGPKLAPTLFWNECRDRAERFYHQIGTLTEETLFTCRSAVHLFRSADEQELFQRRLHVPEFRQLGQPLSPVDLPSTWIAPWGGFEMPDAAQLHVARYLDVTRQRLKESGGFQTGELDPETDLQLDPDAVRIPRWNIAAKRLIFCQGWTATVPSWFRNIQFQPAKGEILTLKLPDLEERRSIHAGCWLARGSKEDYLLGSTFEWDHLDQVPTPAGRESLLKRFRQWYTGTLDVVDQRAAVRPTMRDFKPVLGRHPKCPRLAILNGLGTKGSLMAPWLAELLVNHLEQDTVLPMELDVRRWFR